VKKIDNNTGKTVGFYERGQALFDRIVRAQDHGPRQPVTGPDTGPVARSDLLRTTDHGPRIRQNSRNNDVTPK
jgi:hypothetical protein